MPEDSLAGLAARRPAHRLENLVQALDLLLGLVAMRLEGFLKLRRGRFLRHLGQGPEDLLLGEKHVLQRLGEQVLERIGGFGLWHLRAPNVATERERLHPRNGSTRGR